MYFIGQSCVPHEKGLRYDASVVMSTNSWTILYRNIIFALSLQYLTVGSLI